MDGNRLRTATDRATVIGFSVAAAFGALLIAAGARVTVPMDPVPMTLQTLAVLGVGGVFGWRVGALAAGLYLVAVLAGAPVLAEGRSAPGAAFLELASAGYVVGFVPAAAWAGFGRRGARTVGGSLVLVLRMLVAHALILACGFGWLAHLRGVDIAFEHGVQPFVWGAIVKSVVAAAIASRFAVE